MTAEVNPNETPERRHSFIYVCTFLQEWKGTALTIRLHTSLAHGKLVFEYLFRPLNVTRMVTEIMLMVKQIESQKA